MEENVADLLKVPGRLFHPYHLRDLLRQLKSRFGLQVEAGPARHVVENNGGIGRLRNRLDVGYEAGLGRFVVVRPHHEQPVGPGLDGRGREVDTLPGIIGPGPHDDRDAPVGGFDCQIDESAALLDGNGGILTGRAQHHEARHTAINLSLNEIAEGVLVDLVPGGERSDQRGRSAAKKHVVCHGMQRVGCIRNRRDEAG